MNLNALLRQKAKAVEFSNGPGGLVMKLGQSHTTSGNEVNKFDCEEFSCFPEERETLFFGGDTELRIKGIIQWTQNGWKSYDNFMEPINAIHRMMNAKSLRNQVDWTNATGKKRIQNEKRMNCIVKDLLGARLEQNEMECPQYVMKLASYQKSSTKNVRLDYIELKRGYQWINCILKSGKCEDSKKQIETLNVSNIAVLFNHAESITFVVSGEYDLKEEEWESLVIDLMNIRNMGLTMNFRFELSSNEARQSAMHDMALGYLDELQCTWQCAQKGNILAFNLIEEATVSERSELLCARTNIMIAALQKQIHEQENAARCIKDKKDQLPSETSTTFHIDDPEILRLYQLLTTKILEKEHQLKVDLLDKIGREYKMLRDRLETEPNNQSSKAVGNVNHMVNLAKMVQTVGIAKEVLGEGMREYEHDRDKMIAALIELVYEHNNVWSADARNIWTALKVKDDEKTDIFGRILHTHFKCTQLNTENMVRICSVIIQGMDYQISIDTLREVLSSNGIDGRIYDKTNEDTHQSVNDFAQKFKSYSNCNGQNVRRMYNVLRKWKYIKMKKKAVEKMEERMEETKDDGKEDEKEDTDESKRFASQQSREVYQIGQKWYFWNSLKRHPNFIKSKYGDVKEEVMHSPLLDGMVSVKAWNKLTTHIEAMIATETALRITSNGISFHLYEIRQFEPLDAQHLRALKLWTDFAKLCSKLSFILRSADRCQIAEIANWTRLLTEVVQCYGTPLSPKKTYYRGVNKSFFFDKLLLPLNVPMSTTSSVKPSQSVKIKRFLCLHLDM